jgi:Ca2+/H+ antiporter, TMEM165/GDT1 family
MRRRFFLFPFIGLAAVAVFGAVVMLLWNSILPQVTPAGVISYWQAVGLLVLARILFGGFHFGRHHRHGPPFMRHHWMHMSAEEREKMRAAWHTRCGCGHSEAPEMEQ